MCLVSIFPHGRHAVTPFLVVRHDRVPSCAASRPYRQVRPFYRRHQSQELLLSEGYAATNRWRTYSSRIGKELQASSLIRHCSESKFKTASGPFSENFWSMDLASAADVSSGFRLSSQQLGLLPGLSPVVADAKLRFRIMEQPSISPVVRGRETQGRG